VSPPHPKFAGANFDLSPQAGRGKRGRRDAYYPRVSNSRRNTLPVVVKQGFANSMARIFKRGKLLGM
jgi:hypothetical protein